MRLSGSRFERFLICIQCFKCVYLTKVEIILFVVVVKTSDSTFGLIGNQRLAKLT